MAQGQGFGFGLGKIKELQDAFQKAQQVQQGAKVLQEELETMEIPGQSENGLVTVYLSGNQEPRGIEIDPALLSQDLEIVAGSILEAMKVAYSASTETMRSKMEELTSGLNIPSM
ncbi:MAG: YbaB/EbfC family nucleoid-associated protein [Microcystis sp. M090S1]|uniref:YbaB/EbfC family nucleoid-associated protein n=1 Tax=unclassified Microcystis TaxID=2643300 RepID=UPI00187E773B|nr:MULTISPECIES: YbaB/EbfC family nucleoid-associated protein [unclassified Microcystis]MBE9072635.1 YbaB/EbfC family nucleoid-associated protein [Microcystis sp. LEGE 08355]MCA2812736.1 YbaB/EbfC family nucleoid-associated protein [Microcystis sp. M090S1]MDJ0529365.1 YbaB/EbfC family nucleoid-associated protein [Microcystis sp. M53600_WE12]